MTSTETIQRRIDVSPAEKIITEYGDFIYGLIYSQVENKTQADDIFQDFFLSLVQQPIPQDVKNIKGYLYKALTNDIIDATRKIENYTKHMNKYYAEHNHSINRRNPENALIEVEETNKMFRFIKVWLTNGQYQAMVLRYRADFSLKEVAEKMGVKNTSVSKYIYRGLSEIRQFLKQK